MPSSYTPLLNTPDRCVDDLLEGLTTIHPGIARLADTRLVVDSRGLVEGAEVPRVALVTGGGSGHEPFAAGYVGGGMLSAAVAGSVFTSPPASGVASAITAAARMASEGVLVIVFNYTGDRINFGQAVEKCRAKGIKVEMFISGDDSALFKLEGTAGRRGLCGTLLLLKIVGALAARGATLTQLLDECHAVSKQLCTLGVAASGCTVPGQAAPLFSVPEDMMELGLGVHGEAGVQLLQSSTAADIVDKLVSHMTNPASDTRVALQSGDTVAVIVNNLGSMTQMEMLIIANEVKKALVRRGCSVQRAYAGCLMTSLNMRGFHISLLRTTARPLWIQLLDDPTDAPAWPRPYLGDCVGEDFVVDDLLEQGSNVKTAQYTVDKETSSTVERLLRRVISDIPEWKEDLNELDTGCGDGDCGSTLCEGAKRVSASFASLPYDKPGMLFQQLADMTGEAMGGTSGGIYTILLTVIGNNLTPPPESCNVELAAGGVEDRWIKAFTCGVKAVSEYGGAKPGQRTMLDALYPAAAAAAHASDIPSVTPAAVLRAMSVAADEGARATAVMTARAGRASYVRGGLVQQEDAGARAVANILHSLAAAADHRPLLPISSKLVYS